MQQIGKTGTLPLQVYGLKPYAAWDSEALFQKQDIIAYHRDVDTIELLFPRNVMITDFGINQSSVRRWLR